MARRAFAMAALRSLIGILSIALYVLATVVVFVLIMPLALLKYLIPAWRARLNRCLDGLASGWIEFNNLHQRLLTGTDIQVTGDLDQLSRDQWYLMIANHQSWVDIMALVRVLNRRIPYVKFFYKKELRWVPLLGPALWALDFPMMRRHSRAQIERNPALRWQDMEQTRRACEIYSDSPVTIVNFPEGTRFTLTKHLDQGEPYANLLSPRAGGLAFALGAMQGRLRHLIDVTIFYPEGCPSFWDYACGRVGRVRMHIDLIEIPEDLLGDYEQDRDFRGHFQAWMNRLWQDKDQRLEQMRSEESRER